MSATSWMGGLGAEQILALFALALAASITPGPNNALLSASGARFGLRATLPHARGVAIGFPVMVFAVALGLGKIFQESELLRETLRWVGAALLAWLAFRLAAARPAPPQEGAAGDPDPEPAPSGPRPAWRDRPWSFFRAAAFQWVNPKAWVMCLGVAAPFANGEAPVRDALVAALVFAAAGFLSSHAWAAFGAAMGRFLGRGHRLRIFNVAMAALLLIGAAALLVEDLSAPTA